MKKNKVMRVMKTKSKNADGFEAQFLEKVVGQKMGECTFKGIYGYHEIPDPTLKHITRRRFWVLADGYSPTVQNLSTFNRTVGEKLTPFHLELKDKIVKHETVLSLNHGGIVINGKNVKKRGDEIKAEDVFVHNGGHTDRIFKELFVENKFPKDQWIPIELIEGELSKAECAGISIGRNHGKTMKPMSELNISGKYDWMKKYFENFMWYNKICWQEGETKNHPINVSKLISIMALVDSSRYGENDAPSLVYTSRNLTLDMYAKETKTFERMKPILPEVFELVDFLEECVIETIGKNITKNGKKNEKYEVLVKSVKRYKKTKSHFMNRDRMAVLNDGGFFPIVSTLRVFTTLKNNELVWKAGWTRDKIQAVYKKIMPALIDVTLSKDAKSANSFGKQTWGWNLMYSKVDAAANKM